VIKREFGEFVTSNFSLYFGAFLFAVSVAFIVETDDVWVTAVSGGLTVTATVIMVVFLVQRIFRGKEKASQTSGQA
jgi:hypothetical protein